LIKKSINDFKFNATEFIKNKTINKKFKKKIEKF